MKYKFLCTLCFLCFAHFVFAQNDKPVSSANHSFTVGQGDRAFGLFDFKAAIGFYTKALNHANANEDTTYIIQKIADSYRLLNNNLESEKWYQKLVEKNVNGEKNIFWFAEALRANQKYDLARKYFEEYKKMHTDDKNIEYILAGIDNQKELSTDHGLYKVQLSPINSVQSDFGPAYYKNGSIFFTSNRSGNKNINVDDKWSDNHFYQIYTASPGSGDSNINQIKIVPGYKPNGKFHDGPVAYSEAKNELIFTRSNYETSTAVTASDKRTVNMKLYSMQFTEKNNSIVPLSFNGNEFSNAHPALTVDGKALYFCSDKPGGAGGTDLYESTRNESGIWNQPTNLGAAINSKYDEKFPFISSDGTLYFSSNALDGLGGLDIYKSSFVNGHWTKPENLGAPLNTNYDDFAFILSPDSKSGYFTSNRPGKGDDDIYSFEALETKKRFVVKVIDSLTGQPIASANLTPHCSVDSYAVSTTNANGIYSFEFGRNNNCTITGNKAGYIKNSASFSEPFKSGDTLLIRLQPKSYKLVVSVLEEKTLKPVKDAKVYISDDPSRSFLTNSEGNFETTVISGLYSLHSSDYILTKGSFDTEEDADLETGVIKRSFLVPAKFHVGQTWVLKNIYYDLDKAEIRADAALELDKLVATMNENPTLEVELSSHTDCRASKAYNKSLSQRRANSAVAYIVKKGINKKRIRAAGYGEERLTNDCPCEPQNISSCTQDQHQANRRTEVQVLKY